MQSNLKEMAECYRIGLKLGMFCVPEVMAWIDSVLLAEPEPDIALIEASLCGSRGPSAVALELGGVSGPCHREAIRQCLLSAMHALLTADRRKAPSVAHWLEHLASHEIIVDADEAAYGEMLSLAEYHYLAKEGIVGNVEEVTDQILQFLARYAGGTS